MSRHKEGDLGSSSSGTGAHISSTIRPTAKYNPLSDSLRQMTSGGFSCSMFCGGKSCKYESGTYWREDQMTIKGLYSSWVTDSILAMARPNTENIDKFDIVRQFKQQGIRSVINLQRPGEHSSCGNPLEPDGFSYVPQTFMDNDIFFYNFGWDDYGVQALASILDMVKVMSFATTQGKVGVHCHAGLGRTGVLIACYLVYEGRMDGAHAITYVREKRQGAIQTKGQIECVTSFAQFLIPLRVVFSTCDPSAYPFTLEQYLNRQRHMLHGYEARELKYIPKVVKVVCKRLQELAKCTPAQDSDHPTDLKILERTAPGAFQSRRTKAQGDTDSICSGSTARSSSLEDVNSSSVSLSTPSNERNAKSPMLDTRKKVQTEDEFNSDDDQSGQNRTNMPPKTASDFNKAPNLPGRNSQMTRMPMHRLSSSSLVQGVGAVANFDEIYMVAKALMFDLESYDEGDDVDNPGGVVQSLKARVASLQQNMNVAESAWLILKTEEDPFVLCLLMMSWLEHLKEPFLSPKEVDQLLSSDDDPVVAFKSLKKGQRFTLECILKLVAHLQPLDQDVEESILCRVIQAVCHIPHDQLQKSYKTPRDDDSNEDKDALFSVSQFLVFLRQYIFHLRLRIPRKSPVIQRKQSSSSGGAPSDEAPDPEKEQARKCSNGKPSHTNKGGRGHSSEGDRKSVKDNMPIPPKKKNSLPPIF